MSDFWEVLRLVDFFIAFGCFLVLMYRGVVKVVVSPVFFSWDRFQNLLWCFSTAFGIGEVLYQDVQGGIRVLVVTVVLLVQVWILIFKSPYVGMDALNRSAER